MHHHHLYTSIQQINLFLSFFSQPAKEQRPKRKDRPHNGRISVRLNPKISQPPKIVPISFLDPVDTPLLLYIFVLSSYIYWSNLITQAILHIYFKVVASSAPLFCNCIIIIRRPEPLPCMQATSLHTYIHSTNDKQEEEGGKSWMWIGCSSLPCPLPWLQPWWYG